MWSLHKLFAASRLEGEFFAVVHEGRVLHDKITRVTFLSSLPIFYWLKAVTGASHTQKWGIIKKCDLSGVRGHCNLSQPHLKIIKSYIKTLIPNFTNILITIVEHITFTYLKKSQTFLLWWLNLISLCNNKKLLPSYAYFRAFISVRCPHYFKENVQNTELHLAFFSIYIHFVYFEILCRNCTHPLWTHRALSSTSAFLPCAILLLLWIRLRVFYSFRVYYHCPDSCFRFLFSVLFST